MCLILTPPKNPVSLMGICVLYRRDPPPRPQDTTAIAKQLLTSSGNVASDYVNQLGTQKTAERTAQSTANKAVQTAQDNVKLAELTVTQAQAASDEAKLSGDAKTIQDAQTKLTAAQNALQTAKLQETFAKRNAGALEDPGAAATTNGPKRTMAAGPVIYKIVEDPETRGIHLEPVIFRLGNPLLAAAERQKFFESVKTAPKKDNGAIGNGPTSASQSQHIPDGGTEAHFDAGTNRKIDLRNCKVLGSDGKSDVTSKFELKASGDNSSLIVQRKPGTKGKFFVMVATTDSNGGTSAQVTQPLQAD